MNKYLLLVSLLLTGCDMPKARPYSERVVESLDTVIIEGCEYFLFYEGTAESRVIFMTHKGNCNNPIHTPEFP